MSHKVNLRSALRVTDHVMVARRIARLLSSLVAASSLLLGAREAAAATPCSTLTNPIFVESGDTQEPLLKSLGRRLRDSTVMPVTIVYRTTGTCQLTSDMYGGVKIAQSTTLFYAPSTSEDGGWNDKLPPLQCTVDASGGVPVDLAIGATFISSCTQSPPPAGLGLVTGPSQGYAFIVPKASDQTALTAEEGYMVFGFGSDSELDPWTDVNYLFTRPPSKSTLLTLAASIGVDKNKVKGQPQDTSASVLSLVASSPVPEKTIGLMGTEIYDANRDKVTELAFRAFKQRYAYWPDSSPTSFDKRNLRDGHYIPWSPTVYIAPVDGNGVPTNDRTKLVVQLVLGRQTSVGSDVDGLASVVAKGLVPECAMKVTRRFDGDDLAPYDAPEPCGCYYESKVPSGAGASCVACSDDGPCGGGKCRRGYCEAR